jgi:hypothetical protein
LNIIADGTITSDTNGDITIDPAGTGAIVLTGPITHAGTQTTTGQQHTVIDIRRYHTITCRRTERCGWRNEREINRHRSQLHVDGGHYSKGRCFTE